MKACVTVLTLMIALACWCSVINAQAQTSETNQRDREVDEFTQEILAASATLAGQQQAKVELLTKREREAENDWEKTANAKEHAAGDLRSAQTMVASVGMTKGGAVDMSNYERYERYIAYEAKAREKVSQLNAQEQTEKANLDTMRFEKQGAIQELKRMETIREQQRSALEVLYDAWRKAKTEGNFKELTSQLTQMAALHNRTTDAEFVSEDTSSNKTEGARINYQTELERKNKLPVKATGCTTVKPPATPSCVNKDMPKGWYYVWSVRDRGVTSDKDFYTHVAGEKSTITVVETH
jgi:hypothetical protein